MKIIVFLPALMWAAFILWLSATPGIKLPKSWWEELVEPDKLGHAVVYAILTLLLAWALLKTVGKENWASKWLVMSFLSAILYGILMECMQFAFFPYRSFEVLDILANIIGALIGAFIWKRLITNK